jgi:hypothetical protein
MSLHDHAPQARTAQDASSLKLQSAGLARSLIQPSSPIVDGPWRGSVRERHRALELGVKINRKIEIITLLLCMR